MRTSLSLVAAALLFAASAAMAAQDKVDICHIPPGNPSAAHLITVGADAVPAHEAHGDLGVFDGDDECTCPCLGYRQCVSECDEEDSECLLACADALGECTADCSNG